MQAKRQIKYYLFPILVLAMVWGTVLGRTGALEKDSSPATININEGTSYAALLGDKGDLTGNNREILSHSSIPDFVIATTKVLQPNCSYTSKKDQTDKDILLLISARHSNAVKVLNSNYIIFADKLTHVFLYLFPHHFFW